MRHSAVWYMVKRGILAGIGIIMIVSLLSSVLSGSNFWQVVLESAGNNVALMLLYYIMIALMTGVMVASVPGAIVGGIVGAYTHRFVKTHYTQIMDEQEYARALMWRAGGLSAALVLALMILFMGLGFFHLLFVLLAGIAGAVIGRGYAYYDMNQRREKKKSAAEAVCFQHEKDISRLEIVESDDDEGEDLYELAANQQANKKR